MGIDLGRYAVRAILTYVIVLILLRLQGGKRSLNAATAFDFVFALILADMLDNVIYAETSMPKAAVAIGTLFALHILNQLASYYSKKADRFLDGVPVTLVEDGRAVRRGLQRMRTPRPALDGLLRQFGQITPDEIGEVEHAQVEPGGELSVQKRTSAKMAQKRDLPALLARLRKQP